ncbi:MAG: UvrD-helicase domain-containing protein [Chromatiales bacterium]|nr:UvrD-helicase domain-containing protein [Chromatiales bacterium]
MTTLPDRGARRRALADHGATLLVEAGAGSGKTALMAGRVALLLASGVAPRHIAAITFTELAAGELFTRIAEFIDQLLAGELPPGLDIVLPKGPDEAQRQNLDAARQAIGELTVTTIHGFCQALIRPYPVEAGMDPGARVMDPQAAALAWDDQVDAFLRRQLGGEDDGSAVAAFVMAGGRRAVDRLGDVAEVLRVHRTATAPVTPDPMRAFDGLRTAVARFTAWVGHAPYMEKTTAEVAAELTGAVGHFGTLLGNGMHAGLVRCAAEPVDVSPLTDKGTWRPWGRKGHWEAVASAHGHKKREGAELSVEGQGLYAAVGEAWLSLQSAIDAAAFAAVLDELRTVVEAFGTYKRDAALLDFDDLLRLARDLLRHYEPVRQALGQRYRHVLVDEFQDTDPLQAEILWRLCGEGDAGAPWNERTLRPGALFCVGDPKQAIYRFRGADVDTYVTAREAIRAQHPENILEVTANFRSLSPVLDWVNTSFRTPLSAEGQPGFQDLSAMRGNDGELPGVVQLYVPIEDEPEVEPTLPGDRKEKKKSKQREAEAAEVAKFCRHLIGSYVTRVQRDDPRLRPGDIALLAPGGTELWRYERALEDVGIPVASQAGKGFFRRQEIQDLIAIARCLADRRDTVALGALLRGPLVGLTEEQLLDIVDALPVAGGHEGPARLTLWTSLDDLRNDVAREVLGILQGLARRAHSTTPFDLLAAAVEELRVRALVRQRHPGGAERALANIDLFLEMARPYEVRGLQSFAIDMRTRWEERESQKEGRPDAEEQAVNLITMHSAKGLEWPVVILVNTCTENSRTAPVLYDRARDELHGKLGEGAPAGYRDLQEREKQQSAREDQRLLYVACTRAAEVLVLPHPTTGATEWLSKVELGVAELPFVDLAKFDAGLPPAAPEVVNGQTPAKFAAEAARVVKATSTLTWRAPSRHEGEAGRGGSSAAGDPGHEPLAWDAASGEPLPADWDETDLVRTPVRGGTTRGLVIHKLIEEILTGELRDGEAEVRARAADLLRQLGEAPVDDATRGYSPTELATVTLKSLALPEVAVLRPRLVPELPVYGHATDADDPRSAVATAGVADAIALDATGRIDCVIDWKSDQAPTKGQRDNYRRQLQDYLRLTGAGQGMLVYVTLGRVETVTA